MNIFFDRGASQIPRILGFADRTPHSKTFGCFDRAYWHYKTIDFANARFQEAALTLSLIHTIPGAGNRYYDIRFIKEWALAAIDFWLRSRNGDGSTNESYPHEHHFCATALSLHAASESLLMLGEECDRRMLRTGDFLARNNNKSVANQMAGAAVALHNLYLLTNEHRCKDGAEEKIELLLKMQDSTGFFMEYGGFDCGYDSITLGFLASLFKKTKRQDLKDAAMRCIAHMRPFIDEDGYFSSETMSRKTQFLYPYGFSVFDESMLEKIESGLAKNVIINPQWLDDRYCIPLANSYLMTAAQLQGAA